VSEHILLSYADGNFIRYSMTLPRLSYHSVYSQTALLEGSSAL